MKKAKKPGSPKAFGVRLEECQPAVNHKVSSQCFRIWLHSKNNNKSTSVKQTEVMLELFLKILKKWNKGQTDLKTYF